MIVLHSATTDCRRFCRVCLLYSVWCPDSVTLVSTFLLTYLVMLVSVSLGSVRQFTDARRQHELPCCYSQSGKLSCHLTRRR